MNILEKYFADIAPEKMEKLQQLEGLYKLWNERINVISRKDIDHINERHILHSLSISKIIQFERGTRILDVGTGGGFPGIPLAILFPEVDFYLVDSIGKKISVVEAVADELNLTNVRAEQKRAEKIKDRFDFITSRAVTNLPKFFMWTRDKIARKSKNSLPNGIIYLKGGDFDQELKELRWDHQQIPISDFYEEPFFETKKVVHLFPGK